MPRAELAQLLRALNRVPDGYQVHPKLLRLFKLREEQAAGERPLDWAAGELLAYATLVTHGCRVRLSGQDAKRGTFSHRHAVLFDFQNGAEYCPLARLAPDQAPFEAYNSLCENSRAPQGGKAPTRRWRKSVSLRARGNHN